MLQNQQTAKVAIYARRSPEDKANRTNMFRGDGVSDSIESQILELQQAAQRMGFPEFREYYDDNISGTTFIRKDFARLLEDIQAGTVNTVIIKDLSRLGRDYIESGRYQEIVFPELGTRLIAVNDGYDSATGAGTDMAAFKNVYNIHNKNDTFTVEGVNADLRHYIPTLARRSRCFPRKLENLQDVLTVFVRAYNRFGVQKDRYRSGHTGTAVPFSLFDFF